MDLIFEKSRPGRRTACVPVCDVEELPVESMIPGDLLRDDLDLPELAEVDVVRHYTALSRRNYGADNGFYPLGSCTMKYNPKINEDMAALPGFTGLHPYAPAAFSQGSLQLTYELQRYFSEIFGLAEFSLQPAAGAHGELAGIMIIKKHFEEMKDTRSVILIPDAAHGTNPASSALCGYRTVTVRTNSEGGVDIDHLEELMTEQVAGLMLTNPNTLGLFEKNIERIAAIIHAKGGLLYGDGANANAFLGQCRPGDLGFDILHINLHKTFSTPHGCGGPGSGPIGVVKKLTNYLPVPRIIEKNGSYEMIYDCPDSIGRVKAFYGNFNVLVKAYTYLRTLGPEGIRRISEIAVLNANYIRERLKPYFDLPYDRVCMHECVFSGNRQVRESGVHTLDIAKRLLDYGYHPPTIYFPLVAPEAIMIEPTETESLETLEGFCDTMAKIALEIRENPTRVLSAPITTPVKRLDDVKAARQPDLRMKAKVSGV